MSNHDREGSLPPSRDDDLPRAWREASDEQPPTQLDAAIIAAARKAVADSGKQSDPGPVRVRPRNWLLQWQPLAAAATVAGLAFVLVQLLPREDEFAPSVQRTESVPPPAESQQRSSSVPAATHPSPLPSADKALAQPERVVVPDRAPVPRPVPEPPGPPASPAMAGRNASAPAAAVSTREADLGVAGPLDVAAWSARVAALHASGDVTAAADVLRAFRTADPGADAHLPDSLRDWARSVK